MLSYLLLPLPASSKTSSAVSSLGEVAEFAFQHQLSFSTLKVCLPVRKKWPKPLLHRKGFDCHNGNRHPCIRPADWNIHRGIPKKIETEIEAHLYIMPPKQQGEHTHYLNATKHGQLCMFIIWYYICIQLSPYTYTHKHMYILSYEKDTHSRLTCSISMCHWQFT